MSLCVCMQILPVLEVTPMERELPVVQAFLESDEYKTYVKDEQVCVRTWAKFGEHVTGVYYYIQLGRNAYKCCVWSICILAGSNIC